MKKYLKISFVLVTSLLVFSACFGKNSDASKDSSADASGSNTKVSGRILMNGSTSMEKFANSINEAFMYKYPEVSATVQFTGSGAGIEAVANGVADIANSSRALKEEEKAKGLVENIIAMDGIGVIVNPLNKVENLTIEQLVSIYNGTITNWKEVGGDDRNIVVIGRESGSGTRSAFEELLQITDNTNYSQEIDSTGAVVGKVASIEDAIGYVSIDVINESVKGLSINGFYPNTENIQSLDYTLARPFVMATKGEISEQTPQVQEMFNFINSEEGQAIIQKVGLITVN